MLFRVPNTIQVFLSAQKELAVIRCRRGVHGFAQYRKRVLDAARDSFCRICQGPVEVEEETRRIASHLFGSRCVWVAHRSESSREVARRMKALLVSECDFGDPTRIQAWEVRESSMTSDRNLSDARIHTSGRL